MVAPVSASLGADLLDVVSRLNRLATQRVALPIPAAQARLLSTIEDLDVARISDLAAVDHCSQPTMTTQVRRLEEAGLATRAVDPLDARAVLIRITDKGIETIARVRQDRASSLDPEFDRLSDEDRRTLIAAVEVLHGFLAEIAPARPVR
ncbi:MarR family winged helix-turn-helix transcriptional regulator [Mycolicibacter minnesotensis]